MEKLIVMDTVDDSLGVYTITKEEENMSIEEILKKHGHNIEDCFSHSTISDVKIYVE